MQELQASLDCSDTPSPAPDADMPVAQHPERIHPDSLSDKSDTTIRALEKHCFLQFQLSTHNADKADWIHNLAACMVELHKRGLPIGAKQ
jgi:hypothetical protein